MHGHTDPKGKQDDLIESVQGLLDFEFGAEQRGDKLREQIGHVCELAGHEDSSLRITEELVHGDGQLLGDHILVRVDDDV